MGERVLEAVNEINSIHLILPNNHNFPYPMEDKLGIPNKDHQNKTSIFFPTADPFGIIDATVERRRSKL